MEEFDRERSDGRTWRARDMLRSRIGESAYDAAVFQLYADVLTEMRDDDEAGRYYFLSGERAGRAGELAKAFLDRRTRRQLHLLWGEMPKAASRVESGSIPRVCYSDLEAAGSTALAVRHFIDGLVNAERSRQMKKNALLKNNVRAPQWKQALVIPPIVAFFGAALIVGTAQLLLWSKRLVEMVVAHTMK